LSKVGAVDEVPSTLRYFSERKGRERNLLRDFPALDALDVPADGSSQMPADVDGPMRPCGSSDIETRASTSRNPASNICNSVGLKARLGPRASGETEIRNVRSFCASSWTGNEESTAPGTAPAPSWRRPFEKAEAQIEEYWLRLPQRLTGGGPVEIGKTSFQFGIGDVGVKIAPLHGVQDEFLCGASLVLPVCEQRRGHGRRLPSRTVVFAEKFENGRRRKACPPIAAGSGHSIAIGRFRVFEVEQPVSSD